MIKVTVLSVLFILIGISAHAQRGSGDMPSPEERAKHQTAQMVEKLGLNEEQEGKVSEINLAYAEKMKEIREQAEGDRTAMRTKIEALLTEKEAELKKVLTEEQFKSLEEMKGSYGRGQKEDRDKKGGRKSRKNSESQ